jgi:hypothetical protein
MLKRKLMTALCAMSLTFVGAGCGDDEPTDPNPNPPPAQTYSIGGTVSGLEGTGLALSAGLNNSVTVNADGVFTFPTRLATGTAYTVTVQTQPANQACTVANGTGTVGTANITNVAVTCVTDHQRGGHLRHRADRRRVHQQRGVRLHRDLPGGPGRVRGHRGARRRGHQRADHRLP